MSFSLLLLTRFFATVPILLFWVAEATSANDFSQDQLDFFEWQVRPLLVTHCFECHGPDEAEGGLRLDHRSHVLRGGDRGPALLAGNSAASLIMRAISYDDENLAMPPTGKLKSEQIAVLEKWISQKAPWPDEAKKKPQAETSSDPSRHWAFQPITKPSLPTIRNTAWPKNGIDHFVLAKMEAAGLTPSPSADRVTLVRRAYLDLCGFPPTYDEVQTFIRDGNRIAFDSLLEQLLARREYGERWGRHWLDVAQYADTKGYVDGGQVRFAFAYTYRDYVIRAFNEDG